MKVLYLITRSELGGAQIHLLDLLHGFKDHFEVVLGVGEKGFLTDAASDLNIPFHIVPNLLQPINALKDARALAELVNLIRRVKPDLVHAHTSKAGVLGRLAARLAGVPAIFTAHTWSFAEGTSRKWKMVGIPSERLAARWSRKIITVSEVNRRLALNHRVASEDNLITIHNGIADTLHRAQPGKDGVPRIVMVARCAPQKNQSLLLQAISGVKAPLRLVFVGDGPTKPYLQREASRLGLNDRSDFLGERLDVAEILASSHLFALSTNWEGFPISILEAMRACLPIVASEVGGVCEAVVDEETGFLVPSGSVTALRNRIVCLLTNPDLRRRMGQAGRKRYEENFALAAMLRKTSVVYKSVVSGEEHSVLFD